MVQIKNKGDFLKLDTYFKKSLKITKFRKVEEIVQECIEKLRAVTPEDTGLTSRSWTCVIERYKKSVKVEISNTNIQNGINVALLLEYGHATRNGVWIEGKNYIAPVVLEYYNQILNSTWKELTKL